MIRQYIGLLGQGKTLMMVHDAWPYIIRSARDPRIKIISNQPISIRGINGKDILNIPPTSGQALIDSFFYDYNTLFMLDEAQLIFPSYEKNAITEDLQARFAYVRKYGNAILYTSQGYNHSHKRLRDLTNEVCKVKKIRFGLWKHIAKYYDPERFDASKALTLDQEEQYIIYRKYIWFWSLGKLYKAYDTFFVSTTTISGDGIKIEFKQPKDLGVIGNLFSGL